jgi:hypothetical protein
MGGREATGRRLRSRSIARSMLIIRPGVTRNSASVLGDLRSMR